MSNVIVTDRRGGVFQVVITFNYGECDRLPYNHLRRINARIEQIPKGGIKATAEFNVRNPKDAKKLITVLDLFGEDGSFVHGSPAEPSVLGRAEPPPDDEEEPPIRSATAVSARSAAAGTASAVPSPRVAEVPARGAETATAQPAARVESEAKRQAAKPEGAPKESGRKKGAAATSGVDGKRGISEFFAAAAAGPSATESQEAVDVEMEEETEAHDLDTEDEAEVEEESEAEVEVDAADWKSLGDKAVAESLAANENRLQTISRVARAAGPRYTPAMIRTRLIALLREKYDDDHYVATVMNRRDWRDVTPDEVTKTARA